MASRDLTKDFLLIRKSCKTTVPKTNIISTIQNTNKPGITTTINKGKQKYDVIEDTESPLNNDIVNDTPLWVKSVEEIEMTMKGIKKQIEELNQLHNKRLMINFESDESKQEKEIDIKTQYITVLFRTAEKQLQLFITLGKKAELSDAEFKVRENIHKAIALRLQSNMQDFRISQKQYLHKLQVLKNPGNPAFAILDEPPQRKPTTFVDIGFTQAQLLESENMTKLVDERDIEITKIAKSIEELAAIFKELSVLVVAQGTILDRIDYNMESAVQHAKEGVKNLEKAEEHQKNALPFRCMIVLVILIIMLLGVLIWKNTSSK